MVVDCHVHVRGGEPGELERLLAAADRAAVDRLCVCSLGRAWSEFPTAQELEEAADDVLEACRRRPDRLMGGVYASADHVDASLSLIGRHVADGPLRFVKLWVSQFMDDPRLNPVIERCIELDAPILAHTWVKATGNMTKESTYHHVVNMARRYPEMKVWMAHAGGRWEETGRVILDCPNVCVDVSGGEPEDGIVECLVRHLGPERIFWGSDAPGRSFAVQMSKVLAAQIPEEHKALMLGGNVGRWLHV